MRSLRRDSSNRGGGGTGSIGMTPGAIEPGGVEFQTDSAGVFAANLHLRTASRVIVRMAEFRATAFHELERLARTVRWDEFVAPGVSTSRLRVTCRKSRLYHSDAVALRIGDAIKLPRHRCDDHRWQTRGGR